MSTNENAVKLWKQEQEVICCRIQSFHDWEIRYAAELIADAFDAKANVNEFPEKLIPALRIILRKIDEMQHEYRGRKLP